MGYIAKLAAAGPPRKGVVREAVAAGRAQWQRTFGDAGRNKEEAAFPRVRPVPGGAWERGAVSEPAAMKRLLQAMRSMAPGGWSDDRYEATQRHYTGLPYVAISHKARLASQAEFQVFERDDNHQDGKRPVRRGHPGYDLVKLLERPNRQDSFGDLCADWCIQLDLTGTALTWKVPNQFKTPMELYTVPTAIAIPQPAVNPDYPDGYYRIQPVYPYGPFSSYPTPSSAVGAPIPAQWMMRMHYRHPLLRYDGYSPLTGMSFQLDELNMMDQSRFYKMRGAINPSAVLNPDGKEGMAEGLDNLSEPEIERIRAEMEADHQGPANHGRLLVAARGWRLEEFGHSPKDMDYADGWSQLVDFDMLAFGMTKAGIGMSDSGSYSEAFARIKQLDLMTLGPLYGLYGQALTRDVAAYFGDDLIVEVRGRRIDDHEIAFQKVDKLASNKLGTVNEARKLLDLPTLNPEEYDWADARLGEEPQPQPAPGGTPGNEAGAAVAPGTTPPEAGQEETDVLRNGLAALGEPDAAEPTQEDERPDVGAGAAGSLGPRKAHDGGGKGFDFDAADKRDREKVKELKKEVAKHRRELEKLERLDFYNSGERYRGPKGEERYKKDHEKISALRWLIQSKEDMIRIYEKKSLFKRVPEVRLSERIRAGLLAGEKALRVRHNGHGNGRVA